MSWLRTRSRDDAFTTSCHCGWVVFGIADVEFARHQWEAHGVYVDLWPRIAEGQG